MARAAAPYVGRPRQRKQERRFHLAERHAPTLQDPLAQRLTRGLGLFSVGLGLAELAAPQQVARLSGIGNAHSTTLMRTMGARELVSRIGLLSGRQPARWLQGRVAGDVVDLGVLATAHTPASPFTRRSERPQTGRMLMAGAVVLGVTALDVVASQRTRQAAQRHAEANRFYADGGEADRDSSGPTGAGSEGAGAPSGMQEVRTFVTVNRPIAEVYAFWRDVENFPRFMSHLESVSVLDGGDDGDGRRSRWVARAPLGRSVTWDAEITTDVPERELAWRSLENADITNTGSVQFRPAPGDRGTEVHVVMHYALPGGKAVATVAHLFPENADREVYDDLRAFKQVLETGSVVQSDALAGGSRLKQHAAQPVAAS